MQSGQLTVDPHRSPDPRRRSILRRRLSAVVTAIVLSVGSGSTAAPAAVVGPPVGTPVGAARNGGAVAGNEPGRLPDVMVPGSSVTSPGGRYRCVLQADGNLVVYAGDTPVWHLGTWDRPGSRLVVQGDGNVVLYSADGTPWWFTGTWGHTGTRLMLQEDGNLVLYDDTAALWDSQGWTPRRSAYVGWVRTELRAGETLYAPGYAPSITLEATGDLVLHSAGATVWSTRTRGGSRSRLAFEGGNLVLRGGDGTWLWASGSTDGAALAMQADGNLVVYALGWAPRWDRASYLRRWPIARPPAIPTGNPLGPGWNGGRVKLVQARLGLIRTGSGVTMDAATLAAVAAWQQARGGLRTDGTVDRATWDAMGLGWPFDIDGWMPAVAVGATATAYDRTEQLVRFALSQVGAAYTWGGAGPSGLGYDCSGLVLAGLYSAGLDPWPMTVLAHQGPAYNTAAHFWADARYLALPYAQLRRGDLVFYVNSTGTITHMAIALGGGQVVESAGSAVRVRSMSTPVGATPLPYVIRPFA